MGAGEESMESERRGKKGWRAKEVEGKRGGGQKEGGLEFQSFYILETDC
jgi:hypothetical protein